LLFGLLRLFRLLRLVSFDHLAEGQNRAQRLDLDLLLVGRQHLVDRRQNVLNERIYLCGFGCGSGYSVRHSCGGVAGGVFLGASLAAISSGDMAIKSINSWVVLSPLPKMSWNSLCAL